MGKTPSEEIFGKWQMTTSENFDEFMSKLGVSYLVRKLGNQSKPLVTITQESGALTFKQESLVKTSQFTCKIDEPFEETTADGRKVIKKLQIDFTQNLGVENFVNFRPVEITHFITGFENFFFRF